MHITYDQVTQYERDGYLVLPHLFTHEEVDKLLEAVEQGERVAQSVVKRTDAQGRTTKLAIWHDLGDDIWSVVSTSPRIVNNVRILMGEEISFFHGKVMLKEAKQGGAWEWHQDYGYWYDQGFIYPRLMSVFVALDAATIENGCLQVLKGSHGLDRLNHGDVGDQAGVDKQRLRKIENMFEKVYCQMSPGSVLFFHSNLVHASSANQSERHRRSLILCYCAWSNLQISQEKALRRPPCPQGIDDILQYDMYR